MEKLKRYTISGIIFVLITGTLSHFVYEWSGENYLAGLLFPVNESTWEHMKLIFFPMLVFAVFMNYRLKEEIPCITSALLWGILLGTWLIPVIFYTYSGILGRNFVVFDLATFAISVLCAFAAIQRNAKKDGSTKNCCSWLPAIIVFVMLICFVLFSYHPPALGLFVNPTGA